MRRPARVSVIIPAYNYGRYLESCLTSVLSQTGVALEVLVVDDASTDDTREVAQRIAATDGRVEVRTHAGNAGHIATYNEGLDWASGEYVVLISADDLLTPGALSRAAGFLDAHPEVGLVYGGVLLFHDGEPLPAARTPERPERQVRAGRDWIRGRCRAAENAIVSPEVMVRADRQRALGGYRADLPHSGDLEMWLRFASVSDVGRLPDADQAYHRRHARSMQRRDFPSFVAQARQRQAAFDAFFAGHGRSVRRARALHLLSRRALAYAAMLRALRPARYATATRDDPAALWRFAADCLGRPGDGRLRRWLRLAAAVVSAAPRAAAMSALAQRDLAALPGAALLRRIGAAPRWRTAPPGRAPS